MIFYAAIAWALLFVNLACKPTAPDTEDQEHGHLDVPSFQLSADPVQNPGLGAEMSYRGSAMIFDPAATAAQLSAIVEGTRQTRVTKANWLRVERRDVRPLTQQINDIKLAITGVEAEARQDNNLRAAQEGTSRAWLGHQLDTAGLQGPARVQADAVWGAYCEAKIWELALSQRLVTQNYEQRPTPLQLCEDVYADRQLMTGSRCSPANKSAGKNYFSCLWRDGVMKTALYKARYDTTFPGAPTITKAQKLMALIDDGDLAASLLDDRAPKVISGALAMDSLRFSRIFGAQFKELFIPEGGTPVDAPDLALASAPPSLLIGAVEDGPAAVSAMALHWLPDAPWSKRLTASLKDMGARPLGDLSVSDYLFQRLADGAVATSPLALPVVKNNADFDYIFDAIGPEFAARLKALRQELTQVTAARDVAATRALRLFDEFAAQMTDAASAATLSGDNATLWISSILRVKRLEDGSFEARFSLDEIAGRAARGCFTSPNPATVPCPEEPDVETDPMTITHDPATGALTIVMPMDSNELEIELYPNKIDEILYFYSGLLHIRDGDDVLHEGGINLMTD